MDTKTCNKCGVTKPVSEFFKRKAARDGVQAWCKSCQKATSVEWGRRNPEANRAAASKWKAANESPDKKRLRYRQYRYGVTPEQFDQMLADQDGKCAVCSTTDPGGGMGWCIDHDHTCCAGKKACGQCVRGLLCRNCNTGLGMFNDNPDLLLMAGIYLTRQPQHA